MIDLKEVALMAARQHDGEMGADDCIELALMKMGYPSDYLDEDDLESVRVMLYRVAK